MTGLLGLEEVIRAIVFFLIGRHIVPGWTSLMIVTCVVGGALLVCVGILGQYVGKIYEQGKERPLYLVSRTFNVTTHNTTSA
jgi:dolichol-phosphate mannosyltransferase